LLTSLLAFSSLFCYYHRDHYILHSFPTRRSSNLLIKPHDHIKLLKQLTIGCLTISLVGAIPLVLINDGWFPSLFIAGVAYGIHILTGFAGGVGYAALFGLFGLGIKYSSVIVEAITA